MKFTQVYELTYDHQYDGQNYGLFSTVERAELFLRDVLKIKIEDVFITHFGAIRIYGDRKEYRLEQKVVL